MPASRRSQSLS
uniref:Uncharacterized protein n=1 Tax=Macrostomum lignano TaxID=282301 RepID=A0A1I8F732_9PLAT